MESREEAIFSQDQEQPEPPLLNGSRGSSLNGTGEDGLSPWTFSPTQTAMSCLTMSVTCLVSVLANAGIVYYERVIPDVRRTLLNKLAALTSVYQVGMAATSYPVQAARLLLGRGLGEPACRLQNLLFVCSMMQLFLGYNELVALQYIYACRLGAVGMIKEELVMKLILLANLTLGLFVSLAHVMTINGTVHLYYSFCMNTTIENNQGEEVLYIVELRIQTMSNYQFDFCPLMQITHSPML